MARNEKKIVNRALKYLNSLEACYAHKVHGHPRQRAGVADVLVCYHGTYVALEFKDPLNKAGPTERQKYFLQQIKKAGGEAYVVRSVAALKKRFT